MRSGARFADFEYPGLNFAERPAGGACGLPQECNQAFHPDTAIVELAVFVEVERLQILEQLKNDIAREIRVVDRDLQLLPRPLQRGIAYGVLVELIVRDTLGELA